MTPSVVIVLGRVRPRHFSGPGRRRALIFRQPALLANWVQCRPVINRDRSDHLCAGRRRPSNVSPFEIAPLEASVRELLAAWIPARRSVPNEGRPLIPERPMHLIRVLLGCPINGGALEVVESAAPVRSRRFIGDRVTQKTAGAPQPGPFVSNA